MKISFALLGALGLAAGTSAQVLVTSDITTSTTWTSNNVYNLQQQIYVRNGATLTIQAGTRIESTANLGGSLAVARGSKIEARGKAFTMHNQNAYFRPNEKMIRPVCSNCHSLEFSIDALADPELVESNFNGRPSLHIPSIDWALSRTRRAE